MSFSEKVGTLAAVKRPKVALTIAIGAHYDGVECAALSMLKRSDLQAPTNMWNPCEIRTWGRYGQ